MHPPSSTHLYCVTRMDPLMCHSSLVSLSVAVHHLRNSVHRDRAQHDQKDSKWPFFFIWQMRKYCLKSIFIHTSRATCVLMDQWENGWMFEDSFLQVTPPPPSPLKESWPFVELPMQPHQYINTWMFLHQVTISLAMTIVSLLATFWTLIQLSSSIASSDIFYRHLEYMEENGTEIELHASQHLAVRSLPVSSVNFFQHEASLKKKSFKFHNSNSSLELM